VKIPFGSPLVFNTLAHEVRADAKKAMLSWRDFAGVTASLACAIHCAAMPLVVAYLSALGLSWMAEEGFHQAMAVLCIAIALAAFVPGWRKHRRPSPVLLGAVGLAFLMAAAFIMEPCCPTADAATLSCATACEAETANVTAVACQDCSECQAGCSAAGDATGLSTATLTPWITPLGGLLLVVAHLLNHRFGCSCCAGRPGGCD